MDRSKEQWVVSIICQNIVGDLKMETLMLLTLLAYHHIYIYSISLALWTDTFDGLINNQYTEDGWSISTSSNSTKMLVVIKHKAAVKNFIVSHTLQLALSVPLHVL